MNNVLVVHGCGGHARSVANTALNNAPLTIIFVDPQAKPNEQILTFPVYPEFIKNGSDFFYSHIVAIGSNQQRAALYQNLIAAEIKTMNLIAKTALVGYAAKIGNGNFIGEFSYIGPEAQIGDNNIINTHAVIEHECILGSHNHIAINAAVAGRCKIGNYVMVGAGATIIDGVTLGNNIIIGAGAVVLHDIVESGTYVGVPARKIS